MIKFSPKKRPQWIQRDNDWWINICLGNYSNQDHWENYASGYKDAFEILIERIKKPHPSEYNLIFPVVFLFRHYLELRLKHLIMKGRSLLTKMDNTLKMSTKISKNHDLNNLWEEVRKIREEINKRTAQSSSSLKKIDLVEELVNQFMQVDPKSDVFRYPEGKKGQQYLKNIFPINIKKLLKVMIRIKNEIEGLSTGIEVLIDQEREFHSEYSFSH